MVKGLASKENSQWKKVFETLAKINNDHSIAVLLTYHSKAGQVFFGTENVKTKMKKSFNCTCECNCSAQDNEPWESAFFEDNSDLIGGSPLHFCSVGSAWLQQRP